jgi:hypothetical protein
MHASSSNFDPGCTRNLRRSGNFGKALFSSHAAPLGNGARFRFAPDTRACFGCPQASTKASQMLDLPYTIVHTYF